MFLAIVFAILIILIQIVKTVNIKIEIENIEIQIPKERSKLLNNESKVLLKIYILKKIKIYEINLKKIKINNKKFQERINKIRQDKKYIELNSVIIKVLRTESFSIEKMILKVYEGTEDAAITAIGVGVIATIISNVFRNKIKNPTIQKYEIIPIYDNRNFLKIEFNGIFVLKYTNIKDILKNIIRNNILEV